MLLERLLANSRLLVKFWGNQKFYVDFWLCCGLGPLALALFKGQLYCLIACREPVRREVLHFCKGEHFSCLPWGLGISLLYPGPHQISSGSPGECSLPAVFQGLRAAPSLLPLLQLHCCLFQQSRHGILWRQRPRPSCACHWSHLSGQESELRVWPSPWMENKTEEQSGWASCPTVTYKL